MIQDVITILQLKREGGRKGGKEVKRNSSLHVSWSIPRGNIQLVPGTDMQTAVPTVTYTKEFVDGCLESGDVIGSRFKAVL